MKARLLESTLTFAIVFVVATAVTLAWNLVADGRSVVDWETAVRLAVILGIVLPVVHSMRERPEARS